MKALSLVISVFFISLTLYSQLAGTQPGSVELQPLSIAEMEALKKVPELTMPLEYKSKDLPAIVRSIQTA